MIEVNTKKDISFMVFEIFKIIENWSFKKFTIINLPQICKHDFFYSTSTLKFKYFSWQKFPTKTWNISDN